MGAFISKELINGECLLPKFNPDHYRKIGDDLGRGSFGIVSKLGRVKKSSSKNRLPSKVALKIILVRSSIGADLREYKILKECNHPNILKLFYWKIVEVKDLPKHLYLYTELCDSNLGKFMIKGPWEVNILKHICGQMIGGCSYLHSQNVVHRDIKPENILINENAGPPKTVTVKIADFGFARFMPKEAIESTFQCSTLGTKAYAAPEIIQAFNVSKMVQPKSAFAMDIFSLGVVIFEMFTKELPFTVKDLGKKTFDVEKTVRHYITDSMLMECLIPMLQWDPKLRPDSKKLISMKFFSMESFDVIRVGKSIDTLHHLPEIDVLIIGCWDGSLLTINGAEEQNECVQKHDSWIACIRHHGDIIAVTDDIGKASLWKCSAKTGQLEFLRYLQEGDRDPFDYSIDINAKYIALGRASYSSGGELNVWARETERGESTVVKIVADQKFEDGVHSILIHDDHVLCGMQDGDLVIYDPKEKSVLRRLSVDGGRIVCSIAESENQIYLATWRSGIFCMNDQYEVNKIVETSDSIEQVTAHGGRLYSLSQDGELKCFSLASLASISFKREKGRLSWMEDGTTILAAGDEKYDVFGDKFQISRSTLFIVPPEDKEIVKIVRLLQDK